MSGSPGVRIIQNPNGSGQPVVVGGVTIEGATQSDQSSGQDAPQRSIEEGYEISQRNVISPDSGTISGGVDSAGLGGLKALTRQRNPITITTPEGSIPECLVEDVQRTREGGFVDKFGVEVTWRQILIAETGSVTIRATTGDGPKSGGSGNADSSPQQSLVQSDRQSASDGPSVDTGGGNNNNNNGNGSLSGAANTLDGILGGIASWATGEGGGNNGNNSNNGNNGGGN